MAFPRRLGFESLESRRMLTAVDIPDDLTGQVLAQVATPINIDNASGIRAAEIRVAYDTTILDIAESDITAGSVWAGDATVDVVASVDDAAGTIIVSIFGAEALPATGGSLVEFQFTVQAGAVVGSTAVVDLTQVRLNEGAIVLDTTPQSGPDATDGLITVTEDDVNPTDAMVSGTVYADVNINNQPDATEGLAGITITLINTATNAQLQTTTQSDGRYQFTNVAPGSYRIQELQPAAYLEGGVNEITAELVSGQDLTGQDFREIGLRPEFIYNRLFTTLVMPIGSSNWTAAVAQIHTDAANGIVNAQIVAAATGVPEAEGEASAVPDPQTASAPVATTTALTAEGEAPATPAAEPAASTAIESTTIATAAIVAAEGEASAETVVGSPAAGDSVEVLAPVFTTLAAYSPVVKLETSGVMVSSQGGVDAGTPKPAAAPVDFVWSEDIAQLDAVMDAGAAGDKPTSELPDELLAIDEAFAVADSW